MCINIHTKLQKISDLKEKLVIFNKLSLWFAKSDNSLYFNKILYPIQLFIRKYSNVKLCVDVAHDFHFRACFYKAVGRYGIVCLSIYCNFP